MTDHSLGLLCISMAENGETVALILKPKQSSLPRHLLCKQFSLKILTLPFCAGSNLRTTGNDVLSERKAACREGVRTESSPAPYMKLSHSHELT